MSDELIAPAGPEYELKVAEWFQRKVNGPHDGDDIPIQLTVRQAQKIAAIMGAVTRGHTGYTDALRQASWFLECLTVEARPHMVASRSSAELWSEVDAWSWPRPGLPRDSAEHGPAE